MWSIYMDQELLKVKILSPTQTIFEGEAVSLSSVNSSGKFVPADSDKTPAVKSRVAS